MSKTATFENYHVWGTRGQYMVRLTHYGYTLAERADQGQSTLRELFGIAQQRGFTHAVYVDARGRRARLPLNRFYDRHCI